MKIIKRGHKLRAHDAGASPVPERGKAGDLSDVVARMHPVEATTPPAAGFDLTNVVPFKRYRPEAAPSHRAPAIALTAAERPSPTSAERHRGLKWTVLLLVSLAAHICLYLPFGREPTPMTSVGEVSMSVEIVLGAQTPAGLAPQPSPSETLEPQQAPEPAVAPPKPEPETRPTEVLQAEPTPTETPPPVTEPPPPPTEPPAPVDEPPPTDPEPTEPPPAETPPPVTEPPPPPTEPPAPVEEPTPTEPPARVQETAPELPAPEVEARPPPPIAIEVPQQLQTQEPQAQVSTPPEPPAPIAVVPVPKPTTAPPQAKPAPTKPEAARPRAFDKRQPETRGPTARSDRNESRTRAPAAPAAGGVGRGRSEANTNYRGIVAAHLARYKQFPPEARERGSQGSAVVTFALNGGGRVTSVSLARGTGVTALDQEAVAMVRRASPFPAPPDGRGVSFTVPVSFRLQ